ncbi:signal recognition particle-docking protein FtsY [Propionibacterium freudenreichii]|uniref:Signal recognition particle receptor FtsY n=1 Tax=Propionibacterium freudenreichii subsp. freudenreichii TaxID=66712 RepID=A0A0B7NTX0_PROFF|nr:signal recognition particle-docking protein FtsY [Propionibacterium freudenreichii]CEP27365.1 Signal recognition particle receptor [Propionibacterium freudenreichii subsp. freudenreichii]MCT2974373.1 signal recognition particle-docking protein FtsY [Propionibacterium freudenreichii]MCT2976504.1 signal recognition particle-docking protein FtsY [Propionibacterium freudenreichii]MCT2977358.1 signal recognition particle-docking protein FtsY [Propionibacterium freudenreichii]MCT2984406.1 signal 
MDWVFWVIVAGIVAACAVAYVAVRFGRSNKQVTAAPEAKAVTPTTVEQEPAEQPGAPAAPATAQVAAQEAVSELETPEAPGARLARLRRRLAGSQNTLARALADLLSVDKIDDETWDDFESTLIASDLGVGPATELVENLRKALAVGGVADPAAARKALRGELIKIVGPDMSRDLNLDHADSVPAVVMMVGVNGTGKTTTVGKLGRMLVAQGRTVLFGAADTFRAAAAEQLTTWGERVGVRTVRGDEGADPASVAFNAVDEGITEGVDVVLVDTAGRLHTKVGLMDELGKVKRVIEKKAPVNEVLLVIDATTGQNGLTQARIFAEVVDITGIVLTKLDGSAKGGIVVQVQRELGVPVKFIGLGEGPDDLAPFDAAQFVDGLLGE